MTRAAALPLLTLLAAVAGPTATVAAWVPTETTRAVILAASPIANTPQVYRWVSPPPGFEDRNQPPSGGEAVIPLTNGKSEPASAFTDYGPVIVGLSPGTF